MVALQFLSLSWIEITYRENCFILLEHYVCVCVCVCARVHMHVNVHMKLWTDPMTFHSSL